MFKLACWNWQNVLLVVRATTLAFLLLDRDRPRSNETILKPGQHLPFLILLLDNKNISLNANT